MIQMQNNKPVCTENILHITSGEMTANALRELLPQEEILPFNEAMCEEKSISKYLKMNFID
jgi:hypothetical protein